MKKDQPFNESISIADIKGHSIGTVNGFTIVPEMKKIPGTTEVKLYDNSDGCVRDVVAGRLDFAVLDGPLVDYMILKNPNWNLKQVADRARSGLSAAHQQAAHRDGHEPGQSRPVRRRSTPGVKWMWKTKQNAALMQKYGISNPDYLVPPDEEPAHRRRPRRAGQRHRTGRASRRRISPSLFA